MAPKERTSVLLRLDSEAHEALSRWAADALRGANAHVEFLPRRALGQAGRHPKGDRADAPPRRARPPKHADEPTAPDTDAPCSDTHEETT